MAMQWSCISRAPPWGRLPFMPSWLVVPTPTTVVAHWYGRRQDEMGRCGDVFLPHQQVCFHLRVHPLPAGDGPPTPTYAVGPLPFNTPLPTQRLACAEDAVLYVCCTCTPCSPACLAACDRGWLQLAHTPLYQRHTLPACLLCDLR
jgi:hypothetical protein